MSTRTQTALGAALFALLAAALTFSSTNNGFATDDHFMRALHKGFPGLETLQRSWMEPFSFSKGNVQENEWLRDKGVFPWWSVTNAKLSFFRPLAALTHWFDYTRWRDDAWPMHLQNVFWFALMAALAFLLYRELSSAPWIAWLAAFMYAADEIHGQAVGWISSRNTLMVACAAMCVLIAHHRWRKTKRDVWAVLAFVSFGLGLACGEGAIAVTGYLFAYALVMGYETWRGRFLSLAPYAVISVVYLLLHRAYGFGSAGSSWYADPGADFSAWLKMIGTNIPILLFTEMFAWPGSLLRHGVYAYLVMLVLIVFAFAVMRPMLRSNARARFWLIGALIALVPVSAVVAQPRVLTISAIGIMGLIAEYLSGWFNARQFAKLLLTIVGLTVLIRLLDATLRLGNVAYIIVAVLLAILVGLIIRNGERSSTWIPRASLLRCACIALMCLFVILHLVVGPNLLTVQSMIHGAAGRKLDAAYASLPSDARVVNRDLMVLQGANDFTCYYFMLARSANGQLMPGHLRMLSSSFRPVTIERPDAGTLILRTTDSFVVDRGLSVYRSAKYPMQTGETIRLSGVTVSVLKTDANGWPLDAAFTFDKPLDDDRYLWYTGAMAPERNPRTGRVTRVERYFPVELPAVGETATVQDLLDRSPQYQAALAAAEAPPAKSS
ncbi:MAG: hypothetical protein IT367_03455 [Candidatus Hydrogenedentes bacterium]|nr:hypothetical protein [Candidatus Hydrogenedentota bacterium]